MQYRLAEFILDILASVLAELVLRVIDWVSIPPWL
jgi:hypothetical protein